MQSDCKSLTIIPAVTIRGPKAIIANWLNALRSGKYKQARGTLFDTRTGGYCCLGLLQKVVDGDVEKASDGSYAKALPSVEWLASKGISFTPALETNSPQVPCFPSMMIKNTISSLPPMRAAEATELNDGLDGVKQHTFAEIADYVERHSEGY